MFNNGQININSFNKGDIYTNKEKNFLIVPVTLPNKVQHLVSTTFNIFSKNGYKLKMRIYVVVSYNNVIYWQKRASSIAQKGEIFIMKINLFVPIPNLMNR